MKIFNCQRNLDNAPVAREHRWICTVHLVCVLQSSDDVEEILCSIDRSKLAQIWFSCTKLGPLGCHVSLFFVGSAPSQWNIELRAHAVHALENTLLPVYLQATVDIGTSLNKPTCNISCFTRTQFVNSVMAWVFTTNSFVAVESANFLNV